MNDREAFEKWLISDSGAFPGDREMLQRKDNGEYFWIETYMAFEGWQAARNQALEDAAIVADLGKECNAPSEEIAEKIRDMKSAR